MTHPSRMLFGLLGIMLAIPLSVDAAEVKIGLGCPMTGRYLWFGEQFQRGTALAVDNINAKGGLLGNRLDLIVEDDECNPELGVLVARKFIAEDVRLVVGHGCSGPAIAAAPIYEDAGIIEIAPSASNPKLTDSGWHNVFRLYGRDDVQGTIAGDYLADRWRDRPIAILFDETVYSRGLAEETKKQLNQRGQKETLFVGIDVEGFDWSALVEQMQTAAIDVVYFAGRAADVALLARHARDRQFHAQIVGSDPLVSEQFWVMAGAAGEGTLFTSGPDPRHFATAQPVVEQFRQTGYEPEGYTLYAYAAVQVWAQGVEKAGRLEPEAVVRSIRGSEFDTVLGRISFDDKGDVQGFEPFVWYVWKDGDYAPADQHKLTK